MSNERLEKLKNARYFFHDDPKSDLYKDWKRLIKRVEDLENILEDRNIRLDYLDDVYKKLVKQNKRYREALEEIRNYGTLELNNALKTGYAWIAHEALESEE